LGAIEIDTAVLEPIVQRAVGLKRAQLTDWSVAQIFAGGGRGLGVFRVTGRAQLPHGSRTWSLILKVLPAAARGSSTAWSHPVREALAYRSGLLEALPPGLGAPCCFGEGERGTRHYVWLQDLGAEDTAWTLSDYARAAHQLGCFNGAYLVGRSLPVTGWLSSDWLRSWLAEGAAAIDELPRYRTHPVVHRVYPPAIFDQLAELWSHRECLLVALDRLPHVLCHNDAFRRNLFLRSGRLLAVDWAFLGPGPIGAELAPLVTASAAFLSIERTRWNDLERTAGEAYLQGLRDAGWDGPCEQPRFGFAACSALRYGPGVVRLVLPTLLDETAQADAERLLGIPFDAIVNLWAAVAAEQVRLAAEAFTLLATVR
jgi:hypothetical protein